MKLRFRLLWIVLSSFWKKRINILDTSILNLRVLPNDVDITRISNDRYSALMDLGRMNYAFQLGLLKPMIFNKWHPVVTLNTIRFRYPLKLFQKYQLKTKLSWWDEDTFYWEQVFERKGRILATANLCATVYDENGKVPTKTIIKQTGQFVSKPNNTNIVSKMIEIEKLIHETQKEVN